MARRRKPTALLPLTDAADLHPPRVERHDAGARDLWRLTKGSRYARAVVVTHPLGVELRLLIDQELHQSQMHRNDDALLDQAEIWKQAMIAKDWLTGSDQRASAQTASGLHN